MDFTDNILTRIFLIIAFATCLTLCQSETSKTTNELLRNEDNMLMATVESVVVKKPWEDYSDEYDKVEVVACAGRKLRIICRNADYMFDENRQYASITTSLFRNDNNIQLYMSEKKEQKIVYDIDLDASKVGTEERYVCRTNFVGNNNATTLLQSYSRILAKIYNCTIEGGRPRIYKKFEDSQVTFYCPRIDYDTDDNDRDRYQWGFVGEAYGSRFDHHTYPVRTEPFMNVWIRTASSVEGYYHCLHIDKNSNWSAVATVFDLRVLKRPEPFTNFNFTNITDTTAILIWTPRMTRRLNGYGVSYDVEPKPESYQIRCFNKADSNDVVLNQQKNLTEDENNQTAKIILRNLKPLTIYECTALAWNKLGNSSVSRLIFLTKLSDQLINVTENEKTDIIIEASIGDDIILGCFENVQKKIVTAKTVTVRWTRMEIAGWPHRETEVGIGSDDRRIGRDKKLRISPYLDDNDQAIYKCYLELNFGEINGEKFLMNMSQSYKLITVKQSAPTTMIKNAKCINISSDSLTVIWEIDDRAKNDATAKYKIIYSLRYVVSLRDENIPKSIETSNNNKNVRIDNLSQHSMYKILIVPISSVNDYGEPGKLVCQTETKWDNY